MINFIIYEQNKAYQQIYKDIILQFIGPHFYSYRFRFFESYSRKSIESIANFDGEYIFVLAIEENEQKTLRFAKYLRKNEFWLDPIILISSQENINNLNSLIPITYVDKMANIKTQLNECLKSSFQVLNHHKSYKFKVNNEIYQIPFKHIFYFEKKLNNNSTLLITLEDNYSLNKSISQIEQELEDEYNFFKTHQSCIVNLDNIKNINFSTNVINFGKCQTNLISRNRKKPLKERFTAYHK